MSKASKEKARELKRQQAYFDYCKENVTISVGKTEFALVVKQFVCDGKNGFYIDGFRMPVVLVPATAENGRITFKAVIKGAIDSKSMKGQALIAYKKELAKKIKSFISELNDKFARIDYAEYCTRLYTNAKTVELNRVELSVAEYYGILEEVRNARKAARSCKVTSAKCDNIIPMELALNSLSDNIGIAV